MCLTGVCAFFGGFLRLLTCVMLFFFFLFRSKDMTLASFRSDAICKSQKRCDQVALASAHRGLRVMSLKRSLIFILRKPENWRTSHKIYFRCFTRVFLNGWKSGREARCVFGTKMFVQVCDILFVIPCEELKKGRTVKIELCLTCTVKLCVEIWNFFEGFIKFSCDFSEIHLGFPFFYFQENAQENFEKMYFQSKSIQAVFPFLSSKFSFITRKNPKIEKSRSLSRKKISQ